MSGNGNQNIADIMVGNKLREIRTNRQLSLRALADLSTLNVNTLCLIENGKCSPSVSTLQQLALALEVPIVDFFESETPQKSIVHTRSTNRPERSTGQTQMYNLGKNLAGNSVQPFIVKLPPGMGSGDQMTVHTGHEFVFCVSGTIDYQINDQSYILDAGDSLVFEAQLPHRWQNIGAIPGEILLIFCPSEEKESKELNILQLANNFKR